MCGLEDESSEPDQLTLFIRLNNLSVVPTLDVNFNDSLCCERECYNKNCNAMSSAMDTCDSVTQEALLGTTLVYMLTIILLLHSLARCCACTLSGEIAVFV